MRSGPKHATVIAAVTVLLTVSTGCSDGDAPDDSLDEAADVSTEISTDEPAEPDATEADADPEPPPVSAADLDDLRASVTAEGIMSEEDFATYETDLRATGAYDDDQLAVLLLAMVETGVAFDQPQPQSRATGSGDVYGCVIRNSDPYTGQIDFLLFRECLAQLSYA